MGNLRWLHASAVTVAMFIFLLIVSGAFITSGEEQSWTVPTTIHIVAAIVTGISVLALAVTLTMTEQRRALRVAGWTAAGFLAVNSGLGLKGGLPLTPTLAIVHAVFAPALLATVTAVAIATSAGWQRGPQAADYRGWPSLPTLATTSPFLVLTQIGLGAAYRHKAASVLPHMFGALVVTLLLMTISIVILQHFGDHGSLRRAAIAGLSIVLVQIAVGITAFGMRVLDFDNTSWFVALTVAHVTIGALTLAASVALAMQVRRSVHL
jgi:hypothetical protein